MVLALDDAKGKILMVEIELSWFFFVFFWVFGSLY
jgi:hypothetical protein